MSDAFAGTIATLKEHLQKQEEEARATKRLINQLRQRNGEPIEYPEAESDVASLSALRRDQFYGVPLATAIRKYLEMRRTVGPATVSEIYSALVTGGFKFDAKNEANAKRSLYISLAKNTNTFHKLPGATDDAAVFGMLEWYPNAKAEDATPKAKPKKKPKKTVKRAAVQVPPVMAVGGSTSTKPADKEPKTEPAETAEKGASHEEGKGAGSAARKKHGPASAA